MTILLIGLAVVLFVVLFTAFVLALCKSAALGDQVVIVADSTWPLPLAGAAPARCPACGDPTGVRCCEFGKDAA